MSSNKSTSKNGQGRNENEASLLLDKQSNIGHRLENENANFIRESTACFPETNFRARHVHKWSYRK